MNIEICNAVSGYVQALYVLNQKLIKLCGIDVINKYEYCHKEIFDIIQEIPRLVPYMFDIKKKVLELTDKNGLLEFKNEITYLESSYLNILKDNYSFLDKIRIIRNKYEHKMHNVKRKSSGSGTTTYFEFEFEVYIPEEGQYKSIEVEAVEFIKLTKQLNSLFSLIIKEVLAYSYKEGKSDYPYYQRLYRFDFEDFNKIYNSNLLRTFGKLMLDF